MSTPNDLPVAQMKHVPNFMVNHLTVDISQKIKNVSLMALVEEKSEDHQSP